MSRLGATWRAAAGLFVLAGLVAGCGGGVGGSGSDDGGGGGGGSTQPVSDVVAGARDALDSYWQEHLAEVSPAETFSEPGDWVPYTPMSLPTGECGDAIADNAVYCPADTVIAFDTKWLDELDATFAGGGNMGTIIILAHEYGHHVQKLHGRPIPYDIGAELQADCYAGVFLDGLDQGGYELTLQPGEVSSAMQTLRGIAGQFTDSEWFDNNEHGGPIERTAAIARGYISGDPAFCRSYEQSPPIQTVTVGGYQLRLPPNSVAAEPRSNGSVLVTSADLPDLTLDLTQANNLPSTATQALPQIVDGYFGESRHTPIGDVEDFAALDGLTAASLRFEQEMTDGSTVHGALLLVSRGDGTGMVMDVSAPGAAPTSNDDWETVGDYLFSALWGVLE